MKVNHFEGEDGRGRGEGERERGRDVRERVGEEREESEEGCVSGCPFDVRNEHFESN